MLFQKRILAVAAVLAIGILPAVAAQKSAGTLPASAKKVTSGSKTKDHVAQGSVVAATDDLLTLRLGKKDMSFKMSSTTQKPTTITPGSNVTVNYHDNGTQHIASSIQLAPTKSNATAARPPARK